MKVAVARLPRRCPPLTRVKPGRAASNRTASHVLGHSTVLVEIDGLRVLTDPVWCERASPGSIAGPKRFQPVPLPVEGLPPLDVVVLPKARLVMPRIGEPVETAHRRTRRTRARRTRRHVVAPRWPLSKKRVRSRQRPPMKRPTPTAPRSNGRSIDDGTATSIP